MINFIASHPLYIPFIAINMVVIYKIIKIVLSDVNEKNDDDEDGGIFVGDEPVLDLPPGVTLPVSPKEPIFSE